VFSLVITAELTNVRYYEQIRTYAIHRLSTGVALSPVEKVLLARAHRVAAWLVEGVTSLVLLNSHPLEDLATLGWETAARILWIRDNSSPSLHVPNTLCFRRDAIKCLHCSSSASLINCNQDCYSCRQAVTADAQLTVPGPGLPSGAGDRIVTLWDIQCHGKCGSHSFRSTSAKCNSCSRIASCNAQVRITPNKGWKEMIQEMFGEEIKDNELATDDCFE
jgi:hypothetical protein